MLYEGGVRVPFIFRWPGTIRPGTTCDEPIISVDLYPTLLELAGATRPRRAIRSTASSLRPAADRRRQRPGSTATRSTGTSPATSAPGRDAGGPRPPGPIRAGDWKLIEFFEDGRLELYNLKDDLGEKTDLAEAEPARRDDLLGRLRAWRDSVQAPMPRRRSEAAGAAGPAPEPGRRSRAHGLRAPRADRRGRVRPTSLVSGALAAPG